MTERAGMNETWRPEVSRVRRAAWLRPAYEPSASASCRTARRINVGHPPVETFGRVAKGKLHSTVQGMATRLRRAANSSIFERASGQAADMISKNSGAGYENLKTRPRRRGRASLH